MLRVIDEIRPTWVVGENVAGITTMVESDAVTDLGCYPSLFEEDNGVHRYRDEQTFTIERICKDLESKGYSVQPLLIPAAAIGAPHRRDRIFIIAHVEDRVHNGREFRQKKEQKCERDIWNISPGNSERIHREERADATNGTDPGAKNMWEERKDSVPKLGTITNTDCIGRTRRSGKGYRETNDTSIRSSFHCEVKGFSRNRLAPDSYCVRGREVHQHLKPSKPDGAESVGNGRVRTIADSDIKRLSAPLQPRCVDKERWEKQIRFIEQSANNDGVETSWWDNFPTVSPVHRGNDGLPFDVDNLTISFAKWRTESIKAYGNAIVPQVMYEIFKAIEEVESV